MPLRFRRTIKIAPGVKLNLSKSGVSTTVGTKNLKFNFGKRGVKRTVSIPGTGIQEVDYIQKNKTESEKEKEKRAEPREKRQERLEDKRDERQAHSSEAAIPNTGHAAARAAVDAPRSTGLRNFFVLVAVVVFFLAGASVLGLIPAHFLSNSLNFVANIVRSTGH